MVKFAQVVLGPAGSATCYSRHQSRSGEENVFLCFIANSRLRISLRKAAEEFKYAVSVDIRDLISVDEVGEELSLGPNGALVYCMEFMLHNMEWLEEKLDAFIDNDYLVFDLPGQIELYTHFPFMRELILKLIRWDFRIQALYFLDSQFMADSSKFFGGCITALSAMLQLEVSHLNVMSKMDLTRNMAKRRVEDFMDADVDTLVGEISKSTAPRFQRLNNAMGSLLDDFGMVSFVPLDLTDDESIAALLLMVDLALQYEDELDQNVQVPDERDEDSE
ncbi:GPN-loop GTPase [Gracilaria domingensis]|nr:GPN-loop GTPase [Gracilaria domingensis]